MHMIQVSIDGVKIFAIGTSSSWIGNKKALEIWVFNGWKSEKPSIEAGTFNWKLWI